MEDRIKELKQRQAQTERFKSLEAEEKVKPLKGKAWKKSKAEFEASKEDEKANRDWEEKQGLRDISEENARKIMGRSWGRGEAFGSEKVRLSYDYQYFHEVHYI